VIGVARRYQELLIELELQRRLAGGALDCEVESRLVDALDRCWRAMSDAEQDEAERAFAARGKVDAPTDLNLSDQVVAPGSSVVPRRAA
jgi:hypothetical protein